MGIWKKSLTGFRKRADTKLCTIIIIVINDNFYSALSKSSKALNNQGEKFKITKSFTKIMLKR